MASRKSHMQRRRSQGATYRQIGTEHGVSASTAHRSVNAAQIKPVIVAPKPAPMLGASSEDRAGLDAMLRRGYTRKDIA